MAAANIYLNFPGNTEEAFNFYKSVFGVEFINVQRFSDTPQCKDMSPADVNKIMHIAMPLGNNAILMGTDALESAGHTLTIGNNFSISLATDSEAETDKLFTALSAGGTITMAPEKAFWGAYFGMLTDQFGIQWLLNYDYK